MPTPSSRMESACSNSSQSMPRARSMSAVVRPPIPPPTMIAFMGQTPRNPDATRWSLTSHGPLFGRKRLCRLGPELGPGFRLSLNFEVLEILPVADAVAEYLLLSGQILRRAENVRRAVPGGGLHREGWVDQMRSAQRHEIGPAGGQDGVDLI